MTKANQWFQAAAEKGNPIAQFNLAIFCEQGNTSEEGAREAAKWYLSAAEQGHLGAQTAIARCYFDGYGVPENIPEGLKWLDKAIKKGHADAMERLGSYYLHGYGVAQNYEEAYRLTKQAAELGHPGAQVNLGWMYENGEGVTKDLKEAVSWYRKAAEQGDPLALRNIGNCYYHGIGVQEDHAEGVECYKAAALAGEPVAQFNLAICFEKGDEVEQSDENRFFWLHQAAMQKHANAEYLVGAAYQDGKGVEKDLEVAKNWYTRALAHGCESAQQGLEYIASLEALKKTKGLCKDCAFAVKKGKSYFCGKHEETVTETATCAYFTEKDDVETIERFAFDFINKGKLEEGERLARLAAEQDYVPAKTLLGMYLICKKKTGDLEKNYSEGKYWLILAEAQGDAAAKKMLDDLGVDRKAGVKKSTSKKKSTPKTKGNNTKKSDELRWEIKVCQAAIEKKNKDIKREYHPLRVGFIHFARSLALMIPITVVFFLISCFGWDAHPFNRFGLEDIDFYTKAVLPIFFAALCVELVICMIVEKRVIRKNGSTGRVADEDVIEILSERMRIATSTLAAIEQGAQPDKADTKFHLTFVDAQKKCCANCAHMGEVIKTTTTEYSDGTTTQSSRHDHFYCSKLNDIEVKKGNVCDEFFSRRVAFAVNKAQNLFEKTEAELSEQMKRSSVGFR